MSAPSALLADGRSLSAPLLIQLFSGQCLVLALHLPFMPPWLLGVALAAAGWRFLQLRRRLPRAGVVLRLTAVVGVLAGLWLQYGGLMGMQALMGVLLGIYLLKLLETHDRRDGRVVVIIGFVTLTAAFLHDQSLLMSAAALLAAAWLLQTLVVLAGGRPGRDAWREALWLLALSAPLMVVLFLVVPRIGPLWSLPQADQAATGLSDEIAPGDIAQLSRSDARAFRARFDGAEPPPAERYWRVYTLSQFDGERWTRMGPEQHAASAGQPVSRFVQEASRSPYDAGAPRYIAELLLEPDSRPWRPSLGTPLASDARQRYLADGTLEGLVPLSSRGLLQVGSSAAAPSYPDPAGPAWHRLLPQDANPRSRELAERLWHAAEGDPRRYLAALMARFGESPFRYTLSPPPLAGRDRIDDFLFDTRAGYCTHYASAAAVMARIVGIPARVVVGFQGGERHPDGHFTIRDYDAHAWIEVWLDGAWERLDPTAAIAPQRIEQGAEAFLGGSDDFLADAPFSPLRLRELGWANRLRLNVERAEYRWQRGVIGYQRERREALLAGLTERFATLWSRLGQLTLGDALRLVAVATGLLLLWSAIRRWRQRRAGAEGHRVRLLQAWLAKRGHGPLGGESPAAHLRRIAPRGGAAQTALEGMANDLERLLYAPLPDAERHLRRRRLVRQLAEIKRRWPRRR
ncbi:Transglutaminase-like enzyme, putative cysteine protease [Franzmannia pantelleriensis]|uniref:Transglutaminase-like enzyme, putative cysteine protease n=1 Tax=Franzmannia pantelleriensis TaxID=48727 RepID=A0A1G9I025_9GAMM|nr:DUF3488 and transglutaminase-like domain-containing protein [Halomonas pantelleriensis]SDL18569.1 Transglutaminase-like enzyme, putative cysteine protease [Halomonas pantelleriensis]